MWLSSLPWYDLKEIRRATDGWWRQIARRLVGEGLQNVPLRLSRRIPYERQWNSSRFLFGQACGYDVRLAHASRLRLVSTPTYRAPGCERGMYHSFVVVPQRSRARAIEDLRGSRCVINTPSSHSGMNALRALVAPFHEGGGFFGRVAVSGSHEMSLTMIRRGAADVAAIDCITFALLARHRPGALTGARILCATPPAACPPYVTHVSVGEADVERLRRALQAAFEDPRTAELRAQLLLDGIEPLGLEAYESIAELEASAVAQGYMEFPAAREPRFPKAAPHKGFASFMPVFDSWPSSLPGPASNPEG